MLEKLKNLLNVKSWAENFLGGFLIGKLVKHAATAVVGLLMGLKVQAILTQYGVTVDTGKLLAELTILFTGLAGAVVNWAQKTMNHGTGTPPVA